MVLSELMLLRATVIKRRPSEHRIRYFGVTGLAEVVVRIRDGYGLRRYCRPR